MKTHRGLQRGHRRLCCACGSPWPAAHARPRTPRKTARSVPCSSP